MNLNPSPKQVSDGSSLSSEVLLRDGTGGEHDLPVGGLPMGSGNFNNASLVFSSS